jgi:hypothetical protein
LRGQSDPAERVLAPEWKVAEVEQRLASDDLCEVAWAGYCTAERGLRAALPAVRSALQRLAGDDRSESLFARMLLLDALIGLDERLTLAELRTQSHDMLRVPILLLAARDPEANQAWFAERFASLGDNRNREWRVCGNLLATRATPEFALACVQSLVYGLTVKVVDSKPPPCRCHCFGGPVASKLQLPAGFPPIPVYRLDASNDESRAAGLRCVPFQRERLLEPKQLDTTPVSPQRAYRDWLCSMGDRRTAAACDLPPLERKLIWGSAQQLRKVVAESYQQIVRHHRAMLDELVRAGRIAAEAAKMQRPNVELEIVDDRGEVGHRPLPVAASLLPK